MEQVNTTSTNGSEVQRWQETLSLPPSLLFFPLSLYSWLFWMDYEWTPISILRKKEETGKKEMEGEIETEIGRGKERGWWRDEGSPPYSLITHLLRKDTRLEVEWTLGIDEASYDEVWTRIICLLKGDWPLLLEKEMNKRNRMNIIQISIIVPLTMIHRYEGDRVE